MSSIFWTIMYMGIGMLKAILGIPIIDYTSILDEEGRMIKHGEEQELTNKKEEENYESWNEWDK